METLLLIETAEATCSLGLVQNGSLKKLLLMEDAMRSSENLAPMYKELLAETKISAQEIDAIAVSAGPGSYTGLRVGASFAKGLCFGLNIPLIALSSLQIMAAGLVESEKLKENALLVPMIDARRSEVFTAVFGELLQRIESDGARILDSDFFSETLADNAVYFFGSGSEKFKSMCQLSTAHFVDGLFLSAKFMTQLAVKAFHQQQFEDLIQFEPFYTKAFHFKINQ